MNLLSIVIPVHNRKEFTQACLHSLNRQSQSDFKVIVVDDGSTDGTSEMITKEFSDVILLKGDGNLWWTAATNIGVRHALAGGSDYVMTLNDDTVAQPDFIEKMRYWSSRHPNALLGAVAVDIHTGERVYGGERGDWRTLTTTSLLDVLDDSEMHGVHKVTHFPGRGLLIPVLVFRIIGLFDEKHFPQATADEDFTFRAAKSGFPIYCNYDAKLLTRSRESKGVRLREQYNLTHYFMHLFSRQGAGNLKYYAIHVLKNCPNRYIPYAMARGILARVFGYPRDWFKSVIFAKSAKSEMGRTR